MKRLFLFFIFFWVSIVGVFSQKVRDASIKVNNTKTNNNNGKSISKKCDYCGNRISGIGYSISRGKIIKGKYEDPIIAEAAYNFAYKQYAAQLGIKNKEKFNNVGNYCIRKCAVEAYRSGAGDNW